MRYGNRWDCDDDICTLSEDIDKLNEWEKAWQFEIHLQSISLGRMKGETIIYWSLTQ